MRASTVAWILSFTSLPSAFAVASGKEVAPFTCVVVVVDRQALSWIGGGRSRSFKAAYEKALHNACDELPKNERILCRQKAPMGKLGNTIDRGGEPARPGRARTYYNVTVEIFKPRSRIRAVGRALGFLIYSPPLKESEGFSQACRRAINQACQLLGAKVTPDFDGPAGEIASRPCVGVDWFLAERKPGRPDEPEGAAFPHAISNAPMPDMSLPGQRDRPSAQCVRGGSVRGGN